MWAICGRELAGRETWRGFLVVGNDYVFATDADMADNLLLEITYTL